MPKRYTLHPACKLFPKLSKDELREMADDITANGLREAIVLLDGKILDGQNRYAQWEIYSQGASAFFKKFNSSLHCPHDALR